MYYRFFFWLDTVGHAQPFVCKASGVHVNFSETSAHTLSFAIALLALYPNVQRKVYEEVVRMWPNGPPAMNASLVFSSFL